jgi:replicative DNA helicase
MLAGQSGAGKTTTALNIARRIAARGDHVHFIPLEMTELEHTATLHSIGTGISAQRLLAGPLSDREMDDLRHDQNDPAMAGVHFAPNDARLPKILGLLNTAASRGHRLVILDHLRCVSSPGRDAVERFENTCEQLATHATQLGVVVLALGHLKRSLEGNEPCQDWVYGGHGIAKATQIFVLWRPPHWGIARELAMVKGRRIDSAVRCKLTEHAGSARLVTEAV